MKDLLLDTHVWIWLSIEKMQSLSVKAKTLLMGNCRRWISAISCWELAKLVEKQRILFSIPTLEWINRSLSECKIGIADLTPEICVESTRLVGIHKDPADQLILATSKILGVPLVTADRRLLDYPSANTIW